MRLFLITEVIDLPRNPKEVLLRPRMGLVVNLEHVFDGELSVTLGGRKTLVAEHLLNRAQIGSFLQHVGSEGVAQGVRMDLR